MNLDEAMALMRRADDEVARDSGHDISATYVATVNGSDYFLLYVKDYHYDMSISEAATAEEWNEQNIEWRQRRLNRHGGWTRREVVGHVEGNFLTCVLRCGHVVHTNTIYRQNAKPMMCVQCRDAGYGLDVPDPFTEEVSV